MLRACGFQVPRWGKWREKLACEGSHAHTGKESKFAFPHLGACLQAKALLKNIPVQIIILMKLLLLFANELIKQRVVFFVNILGLFLKAVSTLWTRKHKERSRWEFKYLKVVLSVIHCHRPNSWPWWALFSHKPNSSQPFRILVVIMPSLQFLLRKVCSWANFNSIAIQR